MKSYVFTLCFRRGCDDESLSAWLLFNFDEAIGEPSFTSFSISVGPETLRSSQAQPVHSIPSRSLAD